MLNLFRYLPSSGRWLSIGLLLLLSLGIAERTAAAQPLISAGAVAGLKISEAKSLQQLGDLLTTLEVSAQRTLAAASPDYALQESLITAAGAAVSPLFELYQTSTRSTQNRQKSEALFVRNQALLHRILLHNQAVVRDYQENRLDEMANPTKFFQSAAWQSPQKLISLASYWLGWNGYYASLLMGPDAKVRKTMLEQAVTGFSRSFIDFKEDEITTKSLYGRGLVYMQLELFGRAAYDFKSVKEKVDRNDSLYLNCLYQEAVITHQLGKAPVARQLIQAIRENYLQAQIPAAIQLGIKKLEIQLIVDADGGAGETRSKVARLTKQAEQTPDEVISHFQRLRQVAASDADLFGEFYGYVRDHAAVLGGLSEEELTPVGILAIADGYFEQKDFARAGPLYQQLKSKNPVAIKQQADRVWLNLAFIENGRGNWDGVVNLLTGFTARFPRSAQLEGAAGLYYGAALAGHGQSASKTNYQTLVSASQNYVKHCQNCSGSSDAQFLLGQYYQNMGQSQQAVAAFARVGKESPSYFVAAFHVAAAHMNLLDAQARGEDIPARPTAASRAKNVGELLRQYRSTGRQNPAARPLQPNWALLSGRFELYGSSPDYESALAAVAGFENRFPGRAALLGEVLAVRAAAYQGLGNQAEFKWQIDRLGERSAGDQRAYTLLQNLADRLYSNTGAGEGGQSAVTRSAIICYRQLLSLSMANTEYQAYLPALNLRLGKLYRLAGRRPEAVTLYRQWLVQDRDSADALLGLAETYSEMGQWQAAIEIWRQLSDGLKSGSPEWFRARYQNAIAYQRLDRGDRACTIARMIRVLHPSLDTEVAEQFGAIEVETCPPGAGETIPANDSDSNNRH